MASGLDNAPGGDVKGQLHTAATELNTAISELVDAQSVTKELDQLQRRKIIDAAERIQELVKDPTDQWMDMVAPLPYTYGSVRGPRTNTIPNISIPRHGPSHWRLPIAYSGKGVASIASRWTEASHTMIWLLKWRRKWHCSVRTYLPKWRPGWFNRQ